MRSRIAGASPAGAKGNREFFVHLARGSGGMGEAEYAREMEKLLGG